MPGLPASPKAFWSLFIYYPPKGVSFVDDAEPYSISNAVKPLFPISNQKRILQRIETHHFGSGVVVLRCKPTDDVKF